MMDSRICDEVSIADLFDQFIEASTMKGVLSLHHRILNYSDLEPCEFNIFYPRFKRLVADSRQRKNWRAKAIFSKIDKKSNHRCYSNTKIITSVDKNSNDNNGPHQLITNDALQHHSCLIIGGGPAGLRTAIELQLLGAKRVLVAEKRNRFSRNNVVHLWPFVIDDLKSLGAKKLYGKFCAGSIDHISIRQLQLTLLKICLIIGCDFRESCSFKSNCPSSIKYNESVNRLENDGDIAYDKPKTHTDTDSDTKTTLGDAKICDFDLIEEDAEARNELFNDFARVSSSITPRDSIIPNTATSDQYISNTQNDNLNDLGEDTIDKENIPAKNLSIINSNGISRSSPNITQSTKENLNDRNGTNLPTRPMLRGTRVHFECSSKHLERDLHSQEWDVIIGADGHRNTLKKFFPRKEFRGKLAIAITANFINRQTPTEAAVPEISGISFIYNQDMFNALSYDTDIDLENICYYKDDTHYFVMTAKKKSLLERGVLLSDYATTQQLLDESNVDRQALLKFAKDAAYWTTGLEPLDFALNHYGQEDCAMFDFTSMYASVNACKAVRTKAGGLALFGLVGDSLLEPFWPTGSGCARGFLSSFDAAWMCRQWAVNKCAVLDYHQPSGYAASRSNRKHNKSYEITTNNRMVLSVMAERESIYRILAQTTSENLQQNYSHWTLNPHTRYPNLNRHLVLPSQVEHLVVDDDLKNYHLTPKVESRAKTRVKSPLDSAKTSSSRKSPKKLKSYTRSVMANDRHKSPDFRSLSSLTLSTKSRNQSDADAYWEFEESYRNLSDDKNGPSQYLNRSEIYSKYGSTQNQPEYSIYATTRRSQQISNNIYDDEMARRARDIDDCIRLRRQRNQLSVVRNQLLQQFLGSSEQCGQNDRPKSPVSSAESATLFKELRRLREHRMAANRNQKVDISANDSLRPLFLLNSMRRCASFAERVKSFESKLDVHSAKKESGSMSPKTAPIDNVKNLPQFATLQRLLSTDRHRRSDESIDDDCGFFTPKAKKSKIPIMKLTKDDWNVRCWEERLAAYEKRDNCKEIIKPRSATRDSLIKSKSVDNSSNGQSRRFAKAPKQVEVFKDRIREMANKLELNSEETMISTGVSSNKNPTTLTTPKHPREHSSKGWVSHLRQELINSSQQSAQHGSNLVRRNNQPNRPIKKLFDDDKDQEDKSDGLDPDKHYDHLCVNRPTNKYLSRSNYKSHLSRTRYDKDSSIVINSNVQITAEQKRLYLANIETRASSVTSDASESSTNATTSNRSSSGTSFSSSEMTCPRCKDKVNFNDCITISDFMLHRTCLTCASCSITLRSTEIQFYLNNLKTDVKTDSDHHNIDDDDEQFLCAICKPSIRADLCRAVVDRLAKAKNQTMIATSEPLMKAHPITEDKLSVKPSRNRDDFLTERINYNELYKNIVEDASKQGQNIDGIRASTNNVASSSTNHSHITNRSARSTQFKIAKSESIDGSEVVTLVLPSIDIESDSKIDSTAGSSKSRVMVDEEELERLLHLNHKPNIKNSTKDDDNEDEDDDDSNDNCNKGRVNDSETDDSSSDGERKNYVHQNDDDTPEPSDDSSSLNSNLNSMTESDDSDDCSESDVNDDDEERIVQSGKVESNQ